MPSIHCCGEKHNVPSLLKSKTALSLVRANWGMLYVVAKNTGNHVMWDAKGPGGWFRPSPPVPWVKISGNRTLLWINIWAASRRAGPSWESWNRPKALANARATEGFSATFRITRLLLWLLLLLLLFRLRWGGMILLHGSMCVVSWWYCSAGYPSQFWSCLLD